jgi:hypothetical protein
MHTFDILLSKMYKMGIQETAYDLLSSYLQNWKHCTSSSVFENNMMKDNFTGLDAIQHLVPQRPILGPYLFLCYVNK